MWKALARALTGAALLAVPCFAQHSGLDLKAIDKSVNPCDDFYRYACGNWLKNNPIPPEEATYGSFAVLHDRNQATLQNILEVAAAHQSSSVTDQKIGGFYSSCMNETEIQHLGPQPVEAELQRIRAITNNAQLVDELARLHDRQVGAFFSFSSTPNPKDSRVMIAEIDQDGLGLPEQGYYTRIDAKSVALRDKYLAHIGKMLELTGLSKDDAEARAKRVLALETELAKASLDPTTMRDPQNVVHVQPLTDLEKLAPQFDWATYFQKLQTPAFTDLNVAEPDFFKRFGELLTTDNMNDIRDYLVWHYVHSSATLLPKEFVDENFAFYGQVLSGAKELKPRWKRCVSATDAELGDALGRAFVEKTFGEQGKERTLAMVKSIEAEMEKDIQSISWMTPETKQQALAKLHAIVNKIGYPDKWRDYSTVVITPEDYFGNWYRANQYESKRERDKIGKPADKMEWDFTTPTVNAGYDPLQNTINFPAGILEPPFYSNQATDATNYGAIGMVIGHELTHGFDDEGRQFDASGNLRDWWQKSDEQKFNQKDECFANEASQFQPLPGMKVNGKLTLGENTADNGGMRLAYMALMDTLQKKGVALTERTDGYTPAQQFFLGEAQVWCENIRPEQARMYIQVDPHPPAEFRVNGVVSNMPEFDQAFGCKAGEKMYNVNACRVW